MFVWEEKLSREVSCLNGFYPELTASVHNVRGRDSAVRHVVLGLQTALNISELCIYKYGAQ